MRSRRPTGGCSQPSHQRATNHPWPWWSRRSTERDLLVDGQPLQAGGSRAAGRVVLHLLAELARRHAGWRVEVVANAALPGLDAPAGVAVRSFAPPAELVGRP